MMATSRQETALVEFAELHSVVRKPLRGTSLY